MKPHLFTDLAAVGAAVVAPFAVLESVQAGKKLWGEGWHGVWLHSPHPYSLLFDSAAVSPG